ncbi:hypothetical protein G5B00_02685 [Parapedobacter sp. SGR-10]|nr:hypothetical protein [Parapedobacter sp. SGR-10]
MRPLNNVQTGTLGGTLCSIMGSITMDDIVKTVVLAAIGAVTSYIISYFLSRDKRDSRKLRK